jgi:hypothetical protein
MLCCKACNKEFTDDDDMRGKSIAADKIVVMQ